MIKRYTPNAMAAANTDIPGHANTRTPMISDRMPDASVDFHKCGNKLGTGVVSGVVCMAAV
jgi:hypothetical protein